MIKIAEKQDNISNKIKVINTVKTIIDITSSNILELKLRYENHYDSDSFLKLSEKIQKYSFLYQEFNDTSNTILLRQLLNNPSYYPITIDKNINSNRMSEQSNRMSEQSNNCIYTYVPCTKNILDINYKKSTIPAETSVYVIGIAVDLLKQGDITPDIVSKYIHPEYLDIFKNEQKYKVIYFEEDAKNILIKLFNQLQHAINFNYSVNQLIIIPSYTPYVYKHYDDSVSITSWYSKQEVSYIKLLLNDDRNWVHNLDPVYQLDSNFVLLLYCLTSGIKSEEVVNYIDSKTSSIIVNDKKNVIQLTKIQNDNIGKRYIIIINKLFGSNVKTNLLISLSKSKYLRLPGGSMAIPNMLITDTNPNSILNLLSKDQQKLVLLEYDKQEKFMKEYKKNTCPHVKLLLKLKYAKTEKDLQMYFNEISTYFKDTNVTDFINCINCGFQIMCIHNYNKIQYKLENMSPSNILSNLLKYSLKLVNGSYHEYYCKICGEKLIHDYYIEEHNLKTKSSIDLTETEIEVRSYMWSVIITILQKSTNNDLLINDRKIAMHISDNIKSLLFSKISELTDSNKLIIVIYVCAYFLNMIKKYNIPILNIDITSQTSKIVEKLLIYIYTRYSTIIKSTNTSTDFIKLKFISAYNEIFKQNNFDSNLITNNETKLSTFVFTIDPIYKYSTFIHKLVGTLSDKTDLSPAKLKKEFEFIFGSSLNDIINSAKSNVKNPIYTDIINKRYGKTLQVDSLDFCYKNEDLNIYNNLASLKDENKIISNFLRNDFSLYILASYVIFCKYIKHTSDQIKYNVFLDLLKRFKEVEKIYLGLNKKYTKHPTYLIQYTKDSHFKEIPILITEIFDENGIKHKWKKYYYDSNDDLTDVGCVICGIKRKEIKKINIEKTWKSLNSLSDINTFFNFYKIRCPVENIHTWINNKCSKCKLTVETLDDAIIGYLTDSIFDYYDNFISKFIEEKHILSTELNNIQVYDNGGEYKREYIANKTYDFTSFVKVSEITGVSIIEIESIGIMEGRTYDEIKNKINIPTITIDIIYATYGVYLYILSNSYNKINFKNITRYSLYIDEEIINLHKYIIQNICDLILHIHQTYEDFAITIFKKVINDQLLLTIPIIITLEDNVDDSNIYIGDDIEDNGEDLYEEKLLKGNVNKDVYYSSQNFDYDFTEDNPNNEINTDVDRG
jgi:hypothetical protein